MDEIYTKPVDNGFYEIWFNGEWSAFEPIYFGRMRENEDHSKLFYIAPEKEEELLIMNLNLNVGDSFYMKDVYDQPYYIYVESVFEKDGLRHIQFDKSIDAWTSLITPQPEKMTFIERVGPNWGFGLSEFACTPYYFICKHENDETVYKLNNSCITNCDFMPTSIQEDAETVLSVYPNPAEDYLHVTLAISHNDSYQISVYNAQGRLMLVSENNEKEQVVNIQQFPAGLYFVQYQMCDAIYTQKFIKK